MQQTAQTFIIWQAQRPEELKPTTPRKKYGFLAKAPHRLQCSDTKTRRNQTTQHDTTKRHDPQKAVFFIVCYKAMKDERTKAKTGTKNGFSSLAGGHRTQAIRITSP